MARYKCHSYSTKYPESVILRWPTLTEELSGRKRLVVFDTMEYMKRRCDFGRQPMFCELGPEMCDSIMPNPAEYKNYILRNPVHQLTQNTPNFSQHECNTERAEYATSGANHGEGGWPKDVNVADPEATQRYRRKIEKEDNYLHCVFSAAPHLEHYVLQNNAIDIYQTYYAELESMPPLEKISMRTINTYRDMAHGRPITSLCWEPDGGRHFAVTYVDMDFNRIPNGPIEAYLWDVENANEPESSLLPPCPLFDLQYNPKDNTIMAGGLLSGQVATWDRRHGREPVLICPPHVAHRDLVRNVLFIASKSGMEFFSGGPDGNCKWWDMRNMSDTIEEMIIDVVKYSFDVPSMARSNGISVMEYESTIPTRFMVGTENGKIICGNRKGKTALEKLPTVYDPAHLGPVWALERNPYFMKNFVTVGDWRMQIWSEDCKESPVVWAPQQQHKVTCATWSPTRCSLLLTTGWDGVVSVWDLLRRQHVPVLKLHLCDDPLLRIKAQEHGSLVAVGARNGSIYLTELSHALTQSDKNDKSLMNVMFEREAKREKILEARLREIRLKMRQAEEGGGSPRHSLGDSDPTVGDRDLVEATAEYYNVVKKELTNMV